MKIIIVRHAQTDDNIGGNLAARTSDVLLNEEGVRQARKLGEHLRGEKISHAYVSPQKRAVATAEHILEHHPTAMRQHAEELKEQNMGALDGLPKAQVKEIRKNAKEPWHLFKDEQGESYAELQERAKKFFHDMAAKHPDETILVVSHGGTLGVLLLHILEKELTEEEFLRSTEWTNFIGKGKYVLKGTPINYKHILSHQKIYARFWEVLCSSPFDKLISKTAVVIKQKDIHQYPVSRLIENYLKEKKE